MKESSGKRAFWILKEQVACQRCNEPKQNKLLLLSLFLTLLGFISFGKSTEIAKEQQQQKKPKNREKRNAYCSHVQFLI